MLHSRQFPWDFDVHPGKPAIADIEVPGSLRPAITGLEVELPIDRGVLWIDECPNRSRSIQVARRNAADEPFPVRIGIELRFRLIPPTLQPTASRSVCD